MDFSFFKDIYVIVVKFRYLLKVMLIMHIIIFFYIFVGHLDLWSSVHSQMYVKILFIVRAFLNHVKIGNGLVKICLDPYEVKTLKSRNILMSHCMRHAASDKFRDASFQAIA